MVQEPGTAFLRELYAEATRSAALGDIDEATINRDSPLAH
jgi:hypothetical protein